MDTRAIFQSNRKATQRMRKIIQYLSEKQLSQAVGQDWTAAITLLHLAFWDQRVIHVIEMAKKNNALHAPLFDDQLNDILTPILAAIPPTVAARLALEIAGRLDQLLEECPAELIEQMLELNSRLVERSLHRNDHLDAINAFIKV